MKTPKTLVKITKGFTLIELLVVIAVIGVLAGAIIVAINPTEQLARSRDAGRKSTAQQVADAINAYYTSGGSLPATANYLNSLVTSGDLKSVVAAPASPTCAATGIAATQNGYCYTVLGTPSAQSQFIEYVMLESTAARSAASCTAAQSAYYVYSSSDARAGIVCATGNAGPTTTGGLTYF